VTYLVLDEADQMLDMGVWALNSENSSTGTFHLEMQNSY
jgi:hypothetical protein